MFGIGAGDELARHAPDAAARDGGRDDVAEWDVFGDIETQLDRTRHWYAVEVLGHVTEHVGGVPEAGEHVDEPEQLRLEFGVGERPLQHLLAPPALMERADLLPFPGIRETARDRRDLGLECVRHPASAVPEVRIPQNPDFQVCVIETALHHVADADDA